MTSLQTRVGLPFRQTMDAWSDAWTLQGLSTEGELSGTRALGIRSRTEPQVQCDWLGCHVRVQVLLRFGTKTDPVDAGSWRPEFGRQFGGRLTSFTPISQLDGIDPPVMPVEPLPKNHAKHPPCRGPSNRAPRAAVRS